MEPLCPHCDLDEESAQCICTIPDKPRTMDEKMSIREYVDEIDTLFIKYGLAPIEPGTLDWAPQLMVLLRLLDEKCSSPF